MNGSTYSRRARTALILASDAVAGALLGAATELAGYRVAFASEGDSVPDAIRRVKPVVVLVDATLAAAADPACLGPAMMTSAGVVYFGSARRLNDLKVYSASANAERVALPEQLDRLQQAISAAIARAGSRQPSE